MKIITSKPIKLMLIILFISLFSCATTQNKIVENEEFYVNRGKTYHKKGRMTRLSLISPRLLRSTLGMLGPTSTGEMPILKKASMTKRYRITTKRWRLL